MSGSKDYGVGIDIESIARFKILDHQNRSAFLKRIFTNQELDYCYARKNYVAHLAALPKSRARPPASLSPKK